MVKKIDIDAHQLHRRGRIIPRTKKQMNSKIDKIVVISSNYPMRNFPERGVFVEALVKQWLNMEVMTDVVSPVSLPNLLRGVKKKNFDIKIAGDTIIRPWYISFSNKRFGLIDFKKLSRNNFIKAALKGIQSIPPPDLYYGKFLMGGGAAAYKAGLLKGKPAFADMGESKFLEGLDIPSTKIAKKIIAGLTGIVCVSERLQEEVLSLGAKPEKILLCPNVADKNKFKPMDKMSCRKKLGLPHDAFLVAFTGHFIERKGPLRVLQAIEMLNKDNVFGLFFGQGPQHPKGSKVIHAAPVLNDELTIWLNASDVFVLPTLADGHCNAINEALACGLPVVSSDIPDIRKQLSKDQAIFVNPTDINAIAHAVKTIMNGSVVLKHNQEESNRGTDSSSKDRAAKIMEWMDSRI